jgi:pSer/pThr/pTyr-binding forkhead associated (FHA) protein
MAVRLEVHTAATRSGAQRPLIYEFDQARVTIGRGSSNDVQLPDPTVSIAHASIRVHNTGYAALDEGATNGTYVNGARIATGRPKPLRSRDVLHIGSYAIVVEVSVAVAGSTSSEQTAAMARELARAVLEGRGEALRGPALVVLNGPSEGLRVEIPDAPGRLRIGRAETCELALSDADLSREHAVVRRVDEGVVVEDLGSKNGVRVNGRPYERRKLRDRDEVQLGKTVLCFEDPEIAALKALEGERDAERSSPLLDLCADRERAGATLHAASEGQASTAPAASSEEADGSSGASGAPRPTPAPPGELTSDEPWVGDHPAAAPEAEPPVEPAAKKPRAPGDGRLTDMMIYMLAGAVLAMSAMGLYLLLRAGS